MLKLEYNPILGRMLRLDDLDTLGVSSQSLAEAAIEAGRTAEASALVDYFHQEMRIMHDIMITWLTDLSRYIIQRGGQANNAGELAASLFETWRTFPLGKALREKCQAAISASHTGGSPQPAKISEAIDLLDRLRSRSGGEAVKAKGKG